MPLLGQPVGHERSIDPIPVAGNVFCVDAASESRMRNSLQHMHLIKTSATQKGRAPWED